MKLRMIPLLFLIIFSLFIQINTIEENLTKMIYTQEELVELINSKEFQAYKEEMQNEDLELQGLFGGDECLMPKNDAVKVLSQSYGISNKSPDENLRFILGKCYPVLMIPGIYATKLVVELQCKNIATKERTTTLKNLRLFCGKTLCPDETKIREEHPLFMALMEKAFTVLGDKNDKYSSCLGFMMTFFQNENECPKVNGKNICNYSKYIKVGFYGGSENTVKDGKCGVEGVQNIIQTGDKGLDSLVNLGAAKSYAEMAKTLVKRGYSEGFSLAGLPNDYRRYLATNNFATQVFKKQVERLYSNTGKPVVVVAHSYGTLLALSNLLREKNNKSFLKKIKKFIAIAPPFAGATKLLDAFLHGLNDWNKEVEILGKKIVITNYNIFGQLYMYKTLPTITELRPLPIAAKIFTDPKYTQLGEAIKSRIDLETKCRNKNCAARDLKFGSTKFDSLFKGYFPSLTDPDCAYESNIGGNNNKYTPKYYYQGDCNNKNRYCLEEMYYSNKCPNVYKNTEAVNYLLNRYNTESGALLGSATKKVFESYSTIQEGVKQSLLQQTQKSLTKDLPLPPVDTDLVYTSFVKTPAALVLDDNDFSKKGETLYKGGDDTVPTWSSLLTGFKWIYEKKKNNLPQNIRLIEYCSRLSKYGQYKYNAKKNQKFGAIGCRCLNNQGLYKNSIKACTHAAMINDPELIDYVISIIDDPKEAPTMTESKKLAAKKYSSNVNYESICNNELKRILDTAK